MNFNFSGALHLRSRSVWEAVDSGVLLWRSNFAYFLPFFAIPVWFIAWSLRLLPGDSVYLSYLILWWLKPLFARPLLFIISRNFIGQTTRVNLSAFMNFIKGLPGDLLWRRLRPGRFAAMPIRILENLDSQEFRQRKKDLTRGGLGFSVFLSILALAIEFILLLGEFLFILMLIQLISPSAFMEIWNNGRSVEIIIFILFCFNFFLVESLCVCMGFCLYINCRVELEGWDLQLLFQKFAKNGSKVIPVLLILSALLLPSKAHSNEVFPVFPENYPVISARHLENLQDILSHEDFGGSRESRAIRFRSDRESRELPGIDFADSLERIRLIFSFFLRLIVVLSIAGFVGFLIYLVLIKKLYLLPFGSKLKRVSSSYANFLASSEDPGELFDRAQSFFEKGLLREAWASCLSGCLGAFHYKYDINFPIDATEYDCLNLIRNTTPAEEEKFRFLIESWVPLAYADRPPGEGAFEQVILYCRSLLEEMRLYR
ncbi:MAG: hypothetical protein FWG77_02665 [Treponema sp.]|nr:hypothetical protein [Treponema sp.]